MIHIEPQFHRNSDWLNNHTVKQTPVIDTKPKKLVVLKQSKKIAISPIHQEPVDPSENIQSRIPTDTQPTNVVVPLQESTRIVTLLPAEKTIVELLPDS